MATRNLARSAVEGGKPKVLREMNRFRTRAARRETRVRLHRIDSANAADMETDVERTSEWREFTDHLNPIKRFLEARAGQRWDDVFAELCARYDRRTLKGWHMMDTHVMRHLVATSSGTGRYWQDFPPRSGSWVDEDGILRYTARKRWWLVGT